MREQREPKLGRVPARVVLRGRDDGWHYVVVDERGDEERIELGGTGVTWQAGQRRPDPEPPWWGRRVDEIALGAREAIGRALTDRTFAEIGVETSIAWFAVEEPVEWEGLVTLREPDPARFPGKVAPYIVTLEPGRGALLPKADLLFSTTAEDAWTTLTAVGEQCGTTPPRQSFLCGWAAHRSVRIGRGWLGVCTQRAHDGVERLGEIYATRERGWGGNPELRLRLDGVDLLDEPASDVVSLFEGLGHEVVRGTGGCRMPSLGLRLYGAQEAGRFSGGSLQAPARP
ncbi:hypothetical protein [Spirillospora sp. CA-294931]|uniref:hypothetical protein n=1 Tax=Spirillospora sp. CA-294931 TaxID=3240042 RepID=UPI003D8B65EB